MYRRKFLQWMAMSTTSGLASLQAAEAASASLVTYMVKGFSCPTCAVGLDTTLNKQKGVASSRSTYPEGKVIVCFHPELTNESEIRKSIEEMGFSISGQSHKDTKDVNG